MDTVKGGIMYSLQTENDILKKNVYDLQQQLTEAYIRIKELTRKEPLTEEELVRKVMVSRGVNPNDKDEVINFWSDYYGIED